MVAVVHKFVDHKLVYFVFFIFYEWLDLHRDELMENWERLSNSEAAKKIEPLR